MNNDMDHAPVREQMATALTNGLSADEQSRFEAHLATCDACAAEYGQMRERESDLAALFEGARPAPGFEDRLIQSLRQTAPRRNWVHPMVRRAATGVAAAILLGSAGYVINTASNGGKLPDLIGAARRTKVAANLSQLGSAIGLYSNESKRAGMADRFDAYDYFSTLADHDGDGVSDAAKLKYSFQDANTNGSGSNLATGRTGSLNSDFTVNGDINPGKDDKKIPYGDILRYPSNGPVPSEPRAAGEKPADVKLQFNNSRGTTLGRDVAAFGVPASGKPQQGAPPHNSEHQRQIADEDAKPTEWGQIAPLPAAVPFQPEGEVVGKQLHEGTVERHALGVDAREIREPARTETETIPAKKEKPGETPVQLGQVVAGITENSKKSGSTDELAKHVADFDNRLQVTERERRSLSEQLADPQQPQRPPPTEAGKAVEAGQSGAGAKPEPAPTTRKVIRTGMMEFEVDRFDAALAMITKLTQEAGGYVGTTDSEKLPNGKVKGTVTVRVPPDRLDTLVMQLRGIGDLRSQKMDAQDVTKQYTDLEGELRAARAMEERLLEIIKTGKGEIKDLLAAEKELGVWRGKIEKITGEMKYYDNLVSLTTLTVTIFERDIRTAAMAKETETVEAGIETDDVETARVSALKAIEEAKGRVIQSDLKRHDAGQFSAVVVADVSPDASGPLVDRLKQLGKVARFEVQRKQTTPDGTTQPAPGSRLERADTRINLSLYNLANVAPRQTTNLNLAATDVEVAYKAIAARVTKAGGRVVTSNLSRPQAEQVVGAINFEVKAADADGVLADVRAQGEVMRLTVTENADTNNVTTAKQGFIVQIASIAVVPVRESTNLQIATPDVPDAYNKLRDAVRATTARVTTAQLNEAQRENVTAILDFEVMRTELPAVEDAIKKLGDITQRTSGRSGDTENTVDSKVRLQVSFVDADQLPPRETTALGVETADPDKAVADLQSLAQSLGGRVIQSNLSQERGGQTIGKLVVDVPLAKSVEFITRAKGQGSVRMVQSTKDAQVPAGALARVRVDMTYATNAALVSADQGLWATIRRGLATSITGLMWSLQLIVIGLCFVGPWVLVLVILWKLLKRKRPMPSAAPVAA